MKNDNAKIKNINSQHDWFADCAENYVAYLFARSNNLAIYGSGKWEADIIINNKKTNKWLRIEVRSSVTKDKPTQKSSKKLRDKSDILAEVILKNNLINVKLNKLIEGKKLEYKKALVNPDINEIELWLEQNF